MYAHAHGFQETVNKSVKEHLLFFFFLCVCTNVDDCVREREGFSCFVFPVRLLVVCINVHIQPQVSQDIRDNSFYLCVNVVGILDILIILRIHQKGNFKNYPNERKESDANV